MRLGIDATIRYGLGIPGTRPLTKEHLRSDSPYNTRRFTGVAADADREPRSRLATGRRPAGEGRLSLLRPQARQDPSSLHRRRGGVLPEVARVRLRRLLKERHRDPLAAGLRGRSGVEVETGTGAPLLPRFRPPRKNRPFSSL